MPNGAIHFEGVSKKFRRGERFDSLRDLIPAMGRALFQKATPESELGRQEFWAVREVSFSVTPGEALGIIGPNGAGKSTILKILTKLMRPTLGRAEVRGRAGALLEIGGSLHPDLTGRENVYLQGSIMGMPRVEITRKFDEIVEFSGISDFIDTPVKRYSSGMHARLGFSVAAHLETDVLIIDEVLAVGDTSFQRRAFDRMEHMVASGVPTVIVSHQLERVATLCTHAILITKGRVTFDGKPGECIAAYARHQSNLGPQETSESVVRLDSIAVTCEQPIVSGDPVQISIWGSSPPAEEGRLRDVVLRIRSLETGQLLYATSSTTRGVDLPIGPFRLNVQLEMNVPSGMYSIESLLGHGRKEKDDGNGPSTLLHVKGGRSFWGSVQMKAVMSAEAVTKPSETAGA
jgi:ABC-type polysaccharide/polyol phosphate transport system ATPase subunit